MRGTIPAEIAGEIACLGGLEGISEALPPMRVLNKVAAHHGVLSDRVRLQLLFALGKGTLCVCVLKKIISCPDSRLSYHLAILKRAGLVDFRRDRSYLRYFLTAEGKVVTAAVLSEAVDRR